MTREEAIKFFESVKGKKIRWSSWGDKSAYFIPEKFEISSFIEHSVIYDINGHSYSIMFGFNKDHFNDSWEFYTSFEEELESL